MCVKPHIRTTARNVENIMSAISCLFPIAALFALLAVSQGAVVQQGNTFPEGVVLSQDASISSNADCNDATGHIKLNDNGDLHICQHDETSGTGQWRRVLSSGSLNGNLSTCDGTILAEVISALVDEVQALRDENAALRTPQALQSDLFCSGGGEYDADAGTCSCYSDATRGFYSGNGCGTCANGMGRNANDRNSCTLDVTAPSITLAESEISVLVNTSFTVPTPTLSDNIDSPSTLSSALHVEHNVDIHVPGTYWLYMEVADTAGNLNSLNISVFVIENLGFDSAFPGFSCKTLRDSDLSSTGFVRPSGPYWLRPVESDAALEVYCDMDTDGGGWTMFIRSQTSSLDQHIPTAVNPSQMNSLLPMTIAKLSDTWMNAINPAEYWSMCGIRQAVFFRDQSISWTSNFGVVNDCIANNRYLGYVLNPGDSPMLSIVQHNGGCGGGRDSSNWLPLSGIHAAGGCCDGCYSGGQRGGIIADGRYTHLTNTNNWDSSGYVFIR